MNPSTLTRRQLGYAVGYLALSMTAEAAEALDEITGPEREATPVLQVWAAVRVERAEWADAAAVLGILCEREPAQAGHWVQHAYAKRRHTGIAEARVILRLGLELHPRDPTIHFNLACYAAQSGRLEEARTYLEVACRLDATFEEMAKTDPDLAPLW